MSTKNAGTRDKILRQVSAALDRKLDDANGYEDSLLAAIKKPEQTALSNLDEAFHALIANRPPQNYVGVDASLSAQERMRVFTQRAQAVSTVVQSIPSSAAFPLCLASIIGEENTAIFKGDTPSLEKVDWSSAAQLHFSSDYTLNGQWGLLEAKCGIAETGSVVLWSSDKHATASGFLVDKLIVCVKSRDIVLGLEDIWPLVNSDEALARVRSKTSQAPSYTAYPRAINIITGPSRTADVEQKVQLGAHGPRELYVVIIDDAKS